MTLLRAAGGETMGFHTRSLGLPPVFETDIQRYLDVTRAEMLFAKGVILVEGATEEFLVPAFAAAQNVDLDALGITVCSVRGTDFLPYRRLLSRQGLGIPHVVITDGDPSDHDEIDGIGRGRVLVGKKTQHRVDEALERGDVDTARAALRRKDVFVGEVTLELDLLPNALDAMSNAYGELEASEIKQANFRSDLEAAASGDATRSAAVLDRLRRTGKGRFAQRLASSLETVNPPEYIKDAILRIRSKVRPDE
jgi:putative ATP-dependent endonuclease of OLD family